MVVDCDVGPADSSGETNSEQGDQPRLPPPDRPGTEDFPSRAESRAGAAAANKDSSQTVSKASDNEATSTSAVKRSETQSTGNESLGTAARQESVTSKPSVESKSTAAGRSSDEARDSASDTASSVGSRRITFKLEGGSLRA